jgi:hypothetical protein
MFSVCKAKISRQINDIRDTGQDTENTDHGPDMGFLRTACQPIRIENFEKPYNKTVYQHGKCFIFVKYYARENAPHLGRKWLHFPVRNTN